MALAAPIPAASSAWVTIPDAAAHLGVSVKTIRRRISDGSLVARRFGPRLIRVELASVDALGTPLAVAKSAR
jgi:excisionase family DNA binding protein